MHQIRRLAEADPLASTSSKKKGAEAAGPSQPGPSSGHSSPEKYDMPTAAALLQQEIDKPSSPTPQM